MRGERVPDHFPTAQIQGRGQVQPSFSGLEARDVPDQFQPEHRRGELPADQILDRSREILLVLALGQHQAAAPVEYPEQVGGQVLFGNGCPRQHRGFLEV